jgi:hypothetical protein
MDYIFEKLAFINVCHSKNVLIHWLFFKQYTILQSFQSKTLRIISGAPWYVSNQTLHEDLKIPLIQDMIKSNINKYKNSTSVRENQLIKDLFTQTLEERRLKRIWLEDLLDEV